MKKLAVLVLCIAMMFCLSVTAFAEGGGSDGGINVGAAVIGALIGIVIAVIVMMSLKGQLKSVRMQHAAQNYIKQGSMQVTTAREIYLYKKLKATEKARNID